MRELDQLEQLIGYHFQDRQLLIQALTHSSYLNERKDRKMLPVDNERLEFFGDAIIEFLVSDYLFHRYSDTPEGDMTKLRASMVCEQSLALCSEKIQLGSFLYMGHGEETSGGRQRPSVISDAFEALTAAIYLDGGLAVTREFVQKHLLEELESLEPTDLQGNPGLFFDAKTKLQEMVQRRGNVKLSYELIGEEGPSHNKVFTTAVFLEGEELGKGSGHSKKASQQEAAARAITLLVQKGYQQDE